MRTLAAALAVSIAAAGLAGCLIEPHPLEQPPPIGAWPPAGVAVDIHAAVVLDQDGDGIDDLVLASTAPTAPALYVLLGGFGGLGAGYHAAVTPSMVPLAIDAADVNGDHVPDLIAFGATTANADIARLEAFPSRTPVTFDAAWRKDSTGLAHVIDGAALVRALDFEPDGVVDFVMADELHVEVGRPTAATAIAFGDMPIAPLHPPNDAFVAGALAYLAPRAAGGQDLVLVSGFVTSVWEDIAHADASTAPHDTINNSPQNGFNTATSCDVDGDGNRDVVGGHGGWDTIAPWPLDIQYVYDDMPPFGPPGAVPASACGELDDDIAGRPDLAVLETTPGGVRVNVLADLRLTAPATAGAPGTMSTSQAAPRTLDLPDTTATVMVSGDFDGDGARELLVVARDGHVTCVRVGETLTRCAW